MGTYTDFTIDADRDCVDIARTFNRIPAVSASITLGESFNAKWYAHQDDISSVSVLFPLALIEVNGTVEDGSLWRIYARNGIIQVELPTITWPACTLPETKTHKRTLLILVCGVEVPVQIVCPVVSTYDEAYILAKQELKNLL